MVSKELHTYNPIKITESYWVWFFRSKVKFFKNQNKKCGKKKREPF
ncbi:unnamed protein product, partial [Musa acuminata subsp. burmannicoides]